MYLYACRNCFLNICSFNLAAVLISIGLHITRIHGFFKCIWNFQNEKISG